MDIAVGSESDIIFGRDKISFGIEKKIIISMLTTNSSVFRWPNSVVWRWLSGGNYNEYYKFWILMLLAEINIHNCLGWLCLEFKGITSAIVSLIINFLKGSWPVPIKKSNDNKVDANELCPPLQVETDREKVDGQWFSIWLARSRAVSWTVASLPVLCPRARWRSGLTVWCWCFGSGVATVQSPSEPSGINSRV